MPRFQITNECWEFQEIHRRPRTLPLIYIRLMRNLGLSDCNEAEWQFLLSWTLIIIKNTCIRNKFKYFAHNFYYKAYELFPSSISGKQYMCSRINTVPKAPINKCMKQEAGGGFVECRASLFQTSPLFCLLKLKFLSRGRAFHPEKVKT